MKKQLEIDLINNTSNKYKNGTRWNQNKYGDCII